MIAVDTLRADHLGAWGYPFPTSPNIDRLAAEGVRFSNFFSTASWTRPAMASLLTGLYPRTTGIYEEKFDRLADDFDTLPEILNQHDYQTIGITANPNINAWFGFDQGFDSYSDSGVTWPWMAPRDGQKHYEPGLIRTDNADSVTDQALSAIDRFSANSPTGPFYLQILYIDPHRPWEPPETHRAAVRESSVPGYDGEIHFVDSEIGRLLEGLQVRGFLDDTLVILTSDHGEGLGDHPNVPLSRAHGATLYDSVLRIPLILSHPSLPVGRVVDTLTSSIDLLPTLMDLMGWQLPSAELPGQSLAGSIRYPRAQPAERDFVFAETDWRINRKIALRSRDYRFILNEDSFDFQVQGIHEDRRLDEEQRKLLETLPVEELYRIDQAVPQDPSRNISFENLEIRADLVKALRLWEASVSARPPIGRDREDVLSTPEGLIRMAPGPDGTSLDPKTVEQLEALGYLDN